MLCYLPHGPLGLPDAFGPSSRGSMHHTPTRSLFLLAVFVLGGLGAPWLHEARHAQELAAERTEHVADGHHHHDADETHDAELDAPCPETVAMELQCVLCHGVSAQVAAVRVAVLPPGRTPYALTDPAAWTALADALGYSSRGPPRA